MNDLDETPILGCVLADAICQRFGREGFSDEFLNWLDDTYIHPVELSLSGTNEVGRTK